VVDHEAGASRRAPAAAAGQEIAPTPMTTAAAGTAAAASGQSRGRMTAQASTMIRAAAEMASAAAFMFSR
jgi:hypothetical protein